MDCKVWKINMINGKSHLVYSDESDIVEFTTKLLPQRSSGEQISTFKCASEYISEGVAKYNSVVILGSKVCSVEYYVK